jgi:regulator of sigma E protease
MIPTPPLWLVLIAFVCALGPLVFFHELGHYLVGRAFRIPAETFSIGFGRELLGWTDRQGTRWKIGWLPLGGYVKFVGDMSPASEPGDLESIPADLRKRAFQARPVWQRFLVVLAGPAANFLLAVLIFAAFFSLVGTPISNSVGKVVPNSPAAAAGIRAGDRIVSVGIERANTPITMHVRLGVDELTDDTGQKFERGLLGVSPSTRLEGPVSVTKAVPMAVDTTGRITRSIVDGLGALFRGQVSPKQLGGPIKSPGWPERTPSRGRCPSSNCSQSCQLISDSSTWCPSRCWMEGICFSMSW